jgi:hypothetical protein
LGDGYVAQLAVTVSDPGDGGASTTTLVPLGVYARQEAAQLALAGAQGYLESAQQAAAAAGGQQGVWMGGWAGECGCVRLECAHAHRFLSPTRCA